MLERGGRNTRKLSPILTLRCDTEHTDAKLSGKRNLNVALQRPLPVIMMILTWNFLHSFTV